MTTTPLRRVRIRRFVVPILAVTSLIVVAMTALAAPASASTGPTGGGIFIACGRGGVVLGGGGPNNCPSLTQALDSAKQFSGQFASGSTIELLPGSYCPPDLSDLRDNYRDLNFVGVGLAAYSNNTFPSGFTGEEAELTQFSWDPVLCAGSPTTALVALGMPGAIQHIKFRNLAFVGGGTGAPDTGLDATDGSDVQLRDVIFENLTTGLKYTSGINQESLQVNSSAFVNNTVGLQVAGEAGVAQSTFAGNGTGIVGFSTTVHLINDTISHNTTGVQFPFPGSTPQVVNTINAGNATDCSGATWEPSSTFNTNNLDGATCTHTSTGDILWDATTIPPLADNGGPTMSINPPSQAQDTGSKGGCNATTLSSVQLDQREFVKTSTTLCDIGAVDHSFSSTAVATTSPGTGSLALGAIPVNGTSTAISLFNTGGDNLYGFDVSVSGAGFAVTADSCTFAVMVASQGFGSCFVVVSVTPTGPNQDFTGTLTITTSAGTETFDLTASTGPTPQPPTGATASSGSPRKATVAWTAPATGPAITQYDVQYSSDGGASWTDAPSVTAPATSTIVTGLTDGHHYLFRVAAEDAVGDVSTASTTSPAVTPLDNSSITAATSATINYGSSRTLTGTLTDITTHLPIVGAHVSLWTRAGPSGAFTSGPAGQTDSHGVVRTTVKPHSYTQYEWIYAGAGAHRHATSGHAAITVRQVVHAAVSPTGVHHGKTAKVYGTVSPNASGKTVQLQRLSAGHWINLGHATIRLQTLPNGHRTIGYVIAVTPRTSGTWTMRVSRAATSTNAAGVSGHVTLHVS